MSELKIKITHEGRNGKAHVTHLKKVCMMHLDIIEALVDRATRLHIKPELIEKIFDSGYQREDSK
jgi:hypothetical protein